MIRKHTPTFRVGVVGYSAQKFNLEDATRMLTEAYDAIEAQHPNQEKECVCGLTDLGITSLAYREAVRRGWRTVGIACERAVEYACFPVDERIIEGKEWGEESSRFLDSIDILVRVGGGNQSKRETAASKERGLPVIEYDLPAQQ